VRQSSNPVFRSLPQQQQGGYAQFGTGIAGAQQVAYQQGQPYAPYPPQTGVSRQLTIDDVVTKTGITLGVLSVVAVISYFLVGGSPGLAMPFTLVGSLGGLALVLIATFGRKQGAISWVFGNVVVADGNAGALITQAVLGTIGVFFGMLVVYKTGAIRVTPKFTRFLVAGMIGVLVLMLGNLVMGLFGVGGGEGMGLRAGGPLAIIFSLVCIGLAAFSFLVDFDSADQMIRAGAPEKAAWGVALGLTVTLVWLYVEILRLLSYFRSD
jgi:uncharacterized YccA/Bax inhibitor family protein